MLVYWRVYPKPQVKVLFSLQIGDFFMDFFPHPIPKNPQKTTGESRWGPVEPRVNSSPGSGRVWSDHGG